MVRISGGKLKGRRVAPKKVFSVKVRSDELRPTSAKVREAIFDILQDDIRDATFLELYAGTGAVGLEALSRGAKRVFFVENSHIRSKVIKDYIREIGFVNKAYIYSKKAEDFLKGVSNSGMTFDIIFADPPYASDEIMKIMRLLNEYNVLRQGGCLVVEHSSKSGLPQHIQSLRLVKDYKYGDTMLTLYRKER